MRYFEKFPVITYEGYQAVDITRRAKLRNSVFSNPYNFYDYTVSEGERADQVAQRVYGDPDLAWLIYFANNIVDPYYDWPLSYLQFRAAIVDEFGSTDNAIARVEYWRNNWYDNSDPINATQYNALAPALKNYWTVQIDQQQQIIGYERKQQDMIVNTNVIGEYTVTAEGQKFETGDAINYMVGGLFVGRATVLSHVDDKVIVQHMIDSEAFGGLIEANSDSSKYATTTAFRVLLRNISLDVASYWTAVTAYDLREEQNERRRNIQLLTQGAASATIKQFRTLLL